VSVRFGSILVWAALRQREDALLRLRLLQGNTRPHTNTASSQAATVTFQLATTQELQLIVNQPEYHALMQVRLTGVLLICG
jgi:hypothetical protein